MKILFIDYMSYPGHKNFNIIHINALKALGCSIDYVARKNVINEGYMDATSVKKVVPEMFFRKLPFTWLTDRILKIIEVYWIESKVNFKNYDLILIPTYDIISMFFLRTSCKLIVINHNNVSQLCSRIKLFMTRHLPSHYHHVVLSRDMEKRLLELLPNNRIISYVPHGYVLYKGTLKKPDCIEDNEKYIFCPINRNYDEKFLRQIFSSEALNDFLLSNRIRLYIKKGLPCDGSLSQIVQIDKLLDEEEYNYLLQNSLAVILPYGHEFQYRCSGIFFECVAKQIKIIATNIPALRNYEDDVAISFFSTPDQLVKSIKEIKNIKYPDYYEEKFNPIGFWKTIIKEN